MRKISFPLLGGLMALGFFFSGFYWNKIQQEMTQEDPFAHFEIEELAKQLADSGKFYLPFLNRETLRTGLYTLPAGAKDPQSPHKMDEVYYVLKGKAKFSSGDENIDIKEGSVIFVAANETHRFYDIEEDLQILVFFSTKVPE